MGDRRRRYPPQTLTTAEVESLMAACGDSPAGVRMKALVVVMWRTALRCSEVLALMPWDVDPADCTVRVLLGKGRRSRTVGLEPRAFSVLDDWLKVRAGLGFGDGAPLFCSLHGTSLDNDTGRRFIRAEFARLGRRAGVHKRVHAHGLRHTRAVEMRREGTDVYLISRALGHSNVGTTDRYLSDLFPREVIDAMLHSEWGRSASAGLDYPA